MGEESCDIQILDSYLSSSLGSNPHSWRPSSPLTTGLVLCFCNDPQAMGLFLAKEGGATDHHTLHCLCPLPFKLLSGSMLDNLPLYNHLYTVTGFLKPPWAAVVPSFPVSKVGFENSVSNSAWQQILPAADSSWRLNTPPTLGLLICSYSDPHTIVLALIRESEVPFTV
jgi:hypothetical protein